MSAALARKQLPAFEQLYVSAEIVVLIRGVHFNLDLAEVYLDVFGAFPEPGTRARFVLAENIGSRSALVPALRTGSWPAGIALELDLNGHRIGGAGGGVR